MHVWDAIPLRGGRHEGPALRMPNNPTEATSQSEVLKGRIARRQNSSQRQPIIKSTQLRRVQVVACTVWMALLQAEVVELNEAKATVSKSRKAKFRHVHLAMSRVLPLVSLGA